MRPLKPEHNTITKPHPHTETGVLVTFSDSETNRKRVRLGLATIRFGKLENRFSHSAGSETEVAMAHCACEPRGALARNDLCDAELLTRFGAAHESDRLDS